MSDVPSNLIPTRITQLPDSPVASADSLMVISYQGNTYKIRVGDLLTVLGPVPTTRNIVAGTGLTGGGDLSSDVTLGIAVGGVGNSQLDSTGVTPGTYGDYSYIPVFVVDVHGRVTSASQVLAGMNASNATGVLSVNNGGTSKSMTLDNGGIVWSGSDGLYVGPPGLLGQVLVSNGEGEYTWGSIELELPVAANTVRSGPTSGGSALPTFRSLVNSDLPDSSVLAGEYGSSTYIPVVTVNSKGVVTSVSTTPGGYLSSVVADAPLSGAGTSASHLTHSSSDGNLHVPATSTTNNGKVLTAGATAGSLSWTTPMTGVVADAPLSGSGTSESHLVHASTDGNLHVPATSTTNNGKVLTAGATAGALSWVTPVTGVIGPATNTDGYLPLWNGTNSNTIKNGLAVPDGGLAGLTALSLKQDGFTPTSIKTSAYTAQVNDLVLCDVSGGSFAVNLPNAPADKSRINFLLLQVDTIKELEVRCSGVDTFNISASTSLYMNLRLDAALLQYELSTHTWYVTPSSSPSNFATGAPGVDAQSPLDNTCISVNYATRVLTVTPPSALGYFNVYIDGGGKVRRYRKSAPVNFPAFTDTSGLWYFYFNSTGVAVTTQTPLAVGDFSTSVPIYKILWNKDLFSFTVSAATATEGDTYTNNSSTFTVRQSISGGTTLLCTRTAGVNNPSSSGNLVRVTGSGTNPIVFSSFTESVKSVAEYVEYHQNSVPSSTRMWMHLQGSQWETGFIQVSSIVSGTPAIDGSNTVVSLTTGTNMEDNLEYTVTNSSAGTPWTQDMGAVTSPNNTNGGKFNIYTQNASGAIYFLPASRFPFSFNASSNYAEYISAIGVSTPITSTNFFVCFLYATQNPRTGEAVKSVMYPGQYTNITNASAINWVDIQNTYSYLNDGEVRPLYRLVYEFRTTYNAGNKFSALRSVQDLRKTPITSSATATGSIPASSVTFVPAGNISYTNVQSAIEELDTEKAGLASPVFTGTPTIPAVNFGYQSIATTGGATTFTSATPYYTIFTGTQGQTLTMPDATTLSVGRKFLVDNDSTQAITINANGGGALWIVAPGCDIYFTCTGIGSAAGTWEKDYYGAKAATGKSLTINNTLTMTGTDSSSIAFGTGGTVLYATSAVDGGTF